MRQLELRSQLEATNGTPMFGEVVSWNISGFFNRQSLIEKLREQNIHTRVRMAERRTFLRRALRECVATGLIRQVSEDATDICFALVSEQTDAKARSWKGQVRTAVILAKKTGELTFTVNVPWEAQLRNSLGRNEGGLVASEVGYVLRKILEEDARSIPIRANGGAYFVPYTNLALLEKLDSIAKTLHSEGNGVITLNRLPVASNPRAATDLGGMLHGFVSGRIEQLEAQCKAFLADDDSRISSILKKRKKVNELLKDVSMYEGVLGRTFQAARNRVTAGSVKIQAMYNSKARSIGT